MNKKVVPLIIVLVLGIAGLVAFNYYSSFQTLNITYANSVNVETKIFQDDQEIASLNNSKSLRLKKGEYIVKTSKSDQYSAEEFNITLKDKKQELTIDPSYSESKLAGMLKPQEIELIKIISSNIGLGNEFRVNPGKLYIKGDWYGTTIIPNLSEEELQSDYVDIYRVILKKENGKWTLVTKVPRLVISKLDYPDVPGFVIEDTNRQFGNEDSN